MHGMDGREIEPRVAMWARAEVSWNDAQGVCCRAPATLENTSQSGACLRVRQPFEIGSRLTVRWYREQFCAVARNCHSDGHEFVLGVRRESDAESTVSEAVRNKIDPPIAPAAIPSSAAQPVTKNDTVRATAASAGAAKPQIQSPAPTPEVQTEATTAGTPSSTTAARNELVVGKRPLGNTHPDSELSRQQEAEPSAGPRFLPRSEGGFPRHERKVMQSKSLFPRLWRRQPNEDAHELVQSKEIPVNKPNASAVNPATAPASDLLSYEDIYHAAGIMSPRSGYGIHKVVEMLNSDRLRELSKDVKRVSVLMALDAADTSVDDLLQDAVRRQHALSSYEAAKKKQLEDFEAFKSQENAKIEEEMERVRAHYGERIQQNRDQVAQEKEALRNWQAAMQHEAQRIAEVMELCGRGTEAIASPDGRASGAASQAERMGQNAHSEPRASAMGGSGR